MVVGDNLSFASGSLGDWIVTGGGVELVRSRWQPAAGDQSLDLNLGSAGSVYQDLSTLPGQAYTISFQLAGNPTGQQEKRLLVSWAGAPVGNLTFAQLGTSAVQMGWAPHSIPVIAASEVTRLAFLSLTGTMDGADGLGAFYGPVLDEIRVLRVAEPRGLLLLMAGLANLAWLRRRVRTWASRWTSPLAALARGRSPVAGLFVLLCAFPASGQSVTIGSNFFERGALSFPSSASCISAAGCGGGSVLLVDPNANFSAVSRAQSLVGHRLDLVAIDLNAGAEIQLLFGLAISNLNGAELYLAQAEFLTDLAEPAGQTVKDVQIRFGASTWHTVPRLLFSEDLPAGTPTVFYSDPEIKSDAYRLWFALLDLSSYGIGPDETIAAIDVRGAPGSLSALDLAVVGTTNPLPEAGAGWMLVMGVLLLATFQFAQRARSGKRASKLRAAPKR